MIRFGTGIVTETSSMNSNEATPVELDLSSTDSKQPAAPRELPRSVYETALGVALIAGVFSLIVFGLLLHNHVLSVEADPLSSKELEQLRTSLIKAPQDQTLIVKIRELDLELRRQYFRHREFAEAGAYLLLGGIVLFLISTKFLLAYRRQLPVPPEGGLEPAAELRQANRAFQAVALLGVLVGGVSLVSGLISKGSPLAQEASEAEALPTFASAEEMLQNWPRFRGPNGLGVAQYANSPESWDGASGEGILWKTPIPLPGKNSPVVWEDRIFLTGATEDERALYCVDANSGEILWQDQITGIADSPAEAPEVMDDTGLAAPTVATNGRYVGAIFANGDLVCYDLQGRRIWERNLGMPDNMYGHASSLTTFENLLIVLYDQADAEAGLSSLMAFDMATGEITWDTERPVPNSWATPIVIEFEGRHEIITCADPWVISYDARTGAEIWRVECLSGDVAPSPIYANELVYVTNDYAVCAAIRPGGTGNVTETHIVWTVEDGLPDISSPLSNGELIFLMMTYGPLTCYDAKTGELVWEGDIEGEYQASPTLVGDMVYLLSAEGEMLRIAASREYQELGRASIDERCLASPAFLDGRIYIRGEENLYCIGN